MKRTALWMRLVAVLTCLLMVASCGGDPTGTTATTPTTGTTGTETPAQKDLTILSDGATDYKIIYAASGDSWEKGFATRLQNAVFAVTGVKIPVEADNKSAVDAGAKEIILATPKNNRAATYTAKGGVGYGYNVFVDGNRLIIEAYSKTGAIFALSAICEEYFGVDIEAGEVPKRNEEINAFVAAGDFSATRALASAEMPYLAAPFSEFKLALDEMNYLHYSVGKALAGALALKLATKEEPTIYDIYFGLEENEAYITIKEDEELEPGEWRYTVENEHLISLVAGDYYGFSAAMDAMTARVTSNNYLDLRVGDTEAGNYFENPNLKEAQKTSKYAYERQGEYRVMFYNALWGNKYYDQFEYIARYRDPFQIEMVRVYAPDVLGLQELSANRRGITDVSNLIAGLQRLGYREVIDPAVENMKPISEGGYGTGGGKLITREDGSTYYTFYNCTPLLYNTATTECIAAGYHCYTQQQNEGADTIPAGDAASKALTWGVFRSLETGEVYAAISTHMRAGTVELSQAQEAAEIIEWIEEEYDCPVFFGGDYNSKEGRPCYDYLTEERDYISLQQDKVASIYTSPVSTTHGYPTYEDGEMTAGKGAVTIVGKPHTSIDNIVTPSIDQIDVKVFGVVADFCSLRGSDHLPIFVDFDIK